MSFAVKLSAWVFLVIALLHLLRLILGWQAQIASWNVPVWFSIVPVIGAGYLSYALFKEG